MYFSTSIFPHISRTTGTGTGTGPRLYIQLRNLFNGDKALSDGTNQFLNENWQDILNELKPVLRKAIGNIAIGVIQPVFSKFPYNQLFLS